MKIKILLQIFNLLLLVCITGCQSNDYIPKPKGYHRIELPEHTYQISKTGCPFEIEIPYYTTLTADQSKEARPCWKNLEFPQFNAKLHLSYFRISPESTLNQLTEDARTFVFKHTTKATAIEEFPILIDSTNTFGLEYHIKGNTASNFQFYITDKEKHYLRGALYFNEKPNLDSIQPVLQFIKEDISHLIRTISWK